jgi:hypothetical protein
MHGLFAPESLEKAMEFPSARSLGRKRRRPPEGVAAKSALGQKILQHRRGIYAAKIELFMPPEIGRLEISIYYNILLEFEHPPAGRIMLQFAAAKTATWPRSKKASRLSRGRPFQD